MTDKEVLLATTIFAGVLGILLLAMQPATTPTGQGLEPELVLVCFESACINTELAETPEKRSKGLMFREALGEEEGMLFVFETPAIHPFWMKNTLIPLDMIWIDSGKKVVHVETAVPCTTMSCGSYTPSAPALYVVEANAGFVESNGIEVGDVVEFEY